MSGYISHIPFMMAHDLSLSPLNSPTTILSLTPPVGPAQTTLFQVILDFCWESQSHRMHEREDAALRPNWTNPSWLRWRNRPERAATVPPLGEFRAERGFSTLFCLLG
jgi:hypothetical protein